MIAETRQTGQKTLFQRVAEHAKTGGFYGYQFGLMYVGASTGKGVYSYGVEKLSRDFFGGEPSWPISEQECQYPEFQGMGPCREGSMISTYLIDSTCAVGITTLIGAGTGVFIGGIEYMLQPR